MSIASGVIRKLMATEKGALPESSGISNRDADQPPTLSGAPLQGREPQQSEHWTLPRSQAS